MSIISIVFYYSILFDIFLHINKCLRNDTKKL